MKTALQWIILFLSITLIAGCGFHLRGPMELTPPLKHLYLKMRDPYSQLAHQLQQYLTLSGVELASSEADASTVLVIISETTGEQLLGVGGTQQTRQYNLILTVNFELTDPHGVVLVPPQSITETRPLSIDANEILAGSNEENNVYQQMRGTIVYNLMSRLASKDVATALAKKP